MWYIIIQILFIIIGCILVESYNRYLSKKHKNRYYDFNVSLIFLMSIIWPIVIPIILCRFLYKKYLSIKVNNFINNLSNIWERFDTKSDKQ